MSMRSRFRFMLPAAAVLLACLVVPTLALAQDAPAAAPAAAEAAATVAPAVTEAPAWASSKIDTGSTAWMLVSSALVLLMMPGLALFYGGMSRAKNVLNTFLNVMVCCGVIGVIWVIIGYALVFPVVDPTGGTPGQNGLITMGTNPDNGATVSILGFDKNLIGLKAFGNVTEENPTPWNTILFSGDTVGSAENGVPELIFAIFQGMFAIITPALIIGSVVERIRFGPLLLFLMLWSIIVYCPTAHMVWNVNGWLFQKGVLDFAGGTVVHVLAGVSALAICLVVGPRKGFGRIPMPPHSLGLTLIGAGLLWFGWFGFNAGSAIANGKADLPVAGGVAALAFANTQIAAACAALAWMLVEWIKDGKPTILGFASGMVAGLVVITPCAGFVGPAGSIILGLLGGAVCYFGCQLKKVFKYDDSLDAFGVHGVGGALGAVLVGVFCIRGYPAGMGQVAKQFTGLAVAAIFAFVVSLILAYAIKFTIGLRVKEEDEFTGLDLSLHGEKGYHMEDEFGSSASFTPSTVAMSSEPAGAMATAR
jgi:ammonium transporter, Amt family